MQMVHLRHVVDDSYDLHRGTSLNKSATLEKMPCFRTTSNGSQYELPQPAEIPLHNGFTTTPAGQEMCLHRTYCDELVHRFFL